MAAIALLAALSIGARPALASTAGCTQGVYSGYCGTQTDAEAVPLSWDVFQQHSKAGTRIIGYPDSSSDRAVDLFTFGYQGGQAKVFEYAPGGIASNLCVTEPSKGAGLVLAACSGSAHEQFTATQVADSSTYTWTNVATGDLVTSTGLRGQLAGVTTPSTITAALEWAFAG
jgi:hypothetical protein